MTSLSSTPGRAGAACGSDASALAAGAAGAPAGLDFWVSMRRLLRGSAATAAPRAATAGGRRTVGREYHGALVAPPRRSAGGALDQPHQRPGNDAQVDDVEDA